MPFLSPTSSDASSGVAMAKLIRRHQAAVWRYLRHLGCDDQSAEDLAKETFVVLFRRPFKQTSDAATARWLLSIAKNLFRNHARRVAGRRETGWAEEVDRQWQEDPSDARGGERQAALERCVERLGGRARRAVELSYWQQRSRAEIAGELAMTENGVKTLMQRARASLRACVETSLESES